MTGYGSGPGLTVVQQAPLESTVHLPNPPLAPSKLWRALCAFRRDGRANDLLEQFVDVLQDCIGAADTVTDARERLVAEYGVTALARDVGPDETIYQYADLLAEGIIRGESHLWDALRLTRQLGGGQTTYGPTSTREDIVDGPLQVFAQTDHPPTVVLGLPEGFREAHATRRRRWLALVVALSEVLNVRLACSGLEATWLVDRHARDLPASVSEAAHPARRERTREAAESRARAAMTALGVENPHYDVLRVIADQPGQEAAYGTLYSDSRLSRPGDEQADSDANTDTETETDPHERKRNRVRQQLRRLADLELVDRFGTTDRRVTLRPAGQIVVSHLEALATWGEHIDAMPDEVLAEPGDVIRADLEDLEALSGLSSSAATTPCSAPATCPRCGGANTCDSDALAPDAWVSDVFVVPPCERLCESTIKCRVTHRIATCDRPGGGPAGQHAAGGAAGAPAMNFLSYAEHHAAASGAPQSGGFALADRPVEGRGDPRSVGWSYNADRDEVVIAVEAADLVAATGVRCVAALTCDAMFAQVLTAERLADSDILANRFVQWKARCLGYLQDEYDATDFLDRLRKKREALLQLAGELTTADPDRRAELASTILREAHGLIGTITHVLDQLGVTLVRELRFPDYRHEQRQEILRFLARAVTIGARKGHYSAHRLGWEPRADKRADILGTPQFTDDYTGELLGSWVLVGDGVHKLAPSLERGLEADLDVQDEGQHFVPFVLEPTIVDAYRREAVDDLLERIAEHKHLQPTRATTATLYALCGTLSAIATALIHGLGAEDPDDARELQLFEVHRALGATLATGLLTPAALLPELAADRGHGVQAIVAALLQADAPLSQRALARRADVRPSTVRNHRDVLEGLGLLAVDDGANGHAYRLRLPFRDERREADAPRPRYAPGPSQPFDILDANPSDARYRRSFLRPDPSELTRCLRPPAAVFDYLTAVGVAIDWDYAGLWKRLVDETLRLQDIVPVEYEAAIDVLRQLIGAADAAFPLSGPVARQSKLGRIPTSTQCSLNATVSTAKSD